MPHVMMSQSGISGAAAIAEPPRERMTEAKPVRVTHVSTTDVRGGAARAAHRLHRSLAAARVSSQMLVAQRFGDDRSVFEFNALSPAPSFVGRALFRFSRRLHRPPVEKAGGYFSLDWTVTGRRLPAQLPECDVVNLHWVADFLDYRTLPALAARHPLVWTLHDMNAFTGGCHYSGLCERFTDRCGGCPQLMTSTSERDLTRDVLERKRERLARVPASRLTAVCPSRWLAREAQRSSLFRGFDVRVIPNGIDPGEFHPVSRAAAREQLGLPRNARIVLFVADLVADRRKGLRLLLKALQELHGIPDLLLVTLGRSGNDAGLPATSRHLGSLDSSDALRAAYSAADVFAMPSLQDNLPNTMLESMACGTPVVGFASGGVPEAVIDGETGLLARTGDHVGLAGALRAILESPPLQERLGANGRSRVETEYALSLQAERYATLYRELNDRAGAGDGRGRWEGERTRDDRT